MKNSLTTIFLLVILFLFSLFIAENSKFKTVLNVSTPTKAVVDLNNNQIADTDEMICIDGIETFSTEFSDEFFNKYSKKFDLTKKDMISLGYLAQDFAQKSLENKKVLLKFTGKVTNECRYAQITVDGIDYKDTLKFSGYGLVDDEIPAPDKFKHNLERAKKLNLVILNHHSGKYHTLDCPYGNAAHDKIIIPENQLPAEAKPCKFCHVQPEKKTKANKSLKNNVKSIVPNIIQPPLYVSDGDLRSYYTDFTRMLTPNNRCETNVCQEFVKLINSSKESIDIAIYGYDENPAITKALTQAKQRGVRIRFVYDSSFDQQKNFYKSNSVIANLAEKHISDKSNSSTLSNMIMHNKFVIFDHGIVFTGSMNISSTGLAGYDVNDILIIKSKDVAALYTKEFEQMLGGKFHTQKSKLNQQNRFVIGSSEVEVYFSPKDKQSSRIVELIKNAKNYIYVPTFLITHNEVSNELINAKNRGVDVRIIIDANSVYTRNSKHILLRKNGILLKTENYAGKLHAKTMIIDDLYLITGSMNFSNSGENKNDENTVIVKNSKIAKAHKDFFLYLWTLIPNKYLKYNAHPEGSDSIGSCSDGVDNNFNGKIDRQEVFCQK